MILSKQAAKFSVDCDLNYIISALPNGEYQRLKPYLEPAVLSQGDALYLPDEKIDYIYFPTDGMISVSSLTKNGRTVEIGLIGKEGMTGIDVVLGADTSPYESTVRIPGKGIRIKAEVLRNEFMQCGALHDIMLRYIHAFMLHSNQLVLCNRLHTIEQRLATWLLKCTDRVKDNRLPLTQEFMADMLGANRPTVTTVAHKFQSKGLIDYARGKLTILDTEGLDKMACDCYRIVKREYEDYLNNKFSA